MFDKVFAAHPNVGKIYAVGEMPFLTENEAHNYARRVNKEVVEVLRGDVEAATGANPPANPRSSGKAARVAKGKTTPPAE